MSFSARFSNKCANGHKIVVGDSIAINNDGLVLCKSCPEFYEKTTYKELIYSNKFCEYCFLELPIAGECDCR